MKISLITCVYNTGKYLERCFNSVINQSFKDLELIIVNDGSTDNSQQIIDQYLNKDNRFVSLVQEHSGQAVARNYGLKEAKGDYIVFVDSDDEILEDYLRKLSIVIDKGLDFGYAGMRRVYDKKTNILEKNFKYIHVYDSNITNTFDNPESITKISNSPCAKIFRKQFLIDNNIIFYPDKLYEDLLFISCVLLSNPSLMYVDDYSYIYHIRSGTSMTGNGRRAFELLDVFDAVLDYAKSHNCLNRFKEELGYLALYHIAIGTMYRSFCYKPFDFFKSLKRCRKYLSSRNISNKNKYVDEMSLFERLYLKVFFSGLV